MIDRPFSLIGGDSRLLLRRQFADNGACCVVVEIHNFKVGGLAGFVLADPVEASQLHSELGHLIGHIRGPTCGPTLTAQNFRTTMRDRLP